MTMPIDRAIFVSAGLALLFILINVLLGTRLELRFLDTWLILGVWALVVSMTSYARARLAQRAAEEAQDKAARRLPDGRSLFGETAEEPFSAAKSALQFDRFGLPSISILIAVGLFAWIAWLGGQPASKAARGSLTDPLVAASFLLAEAFAAFLLSRYLIAVSREREASSGRAPGLALGLLALASFAGAGAALADRFHVDLADRMLRIALLVVSGALAIEQLALAIIAMYVPARRRAPTIESRLAAFVADPASWTATVASSIDYQFGVRAGHDAIRQFLRRAILPLIALQLALLYALTSFVFLEPHEVGIRERFGRPLAERWLLVSGAHVIAPWPFEKVVRVPAKRIQRIEVGFRSDPQSARPPAVLWTVPHYADEDVFVSAARLGGRTNEFGAVSVSLATINLSIEYRITNIWSYAYTYRDPARLLRDAAYRVVTRAFASRDLLDLLGTERLGFPESIRRDLQNDADRLGLGVEILAASDLGIHPPVTSAEAFQTVISALEKRDASLAEARAYAASVKPRAAAEAEKARLAAEADRAALRLRAESEAELFQRLLDADRSAPAVLRQDLRLASLAESLKGRAFTVLAHTDARRTLLFDLKPQSLPELYELAPFPFGDEMP